jgi:hypothetical protein
VISPLVSLILLSILFIFASNSSTHALFIKRAKELLFVVSIIVLIYLMCLQNDYMPPFKTLLEKAGVSLGSRALSFFLINMGCSGGLALAIGFAVRALLATEAAPPFRNMMLPTEGYGASSSEVQAVSAA